jgi:hypothetical protein
MRCKDNFGNLLSKVSRNIFPCERQTGSGTNFFHATERFLSLAERANVVWDKGTFVDSILFNNYLLMLYSINRQFVELSYDVKGGNIVWITLANEYDLAKYLDNIQIAV